MGGRGTEVCHEEEPSETGEESHEQCVYGVLSWQPDNTFYHDTDSPILLNHASGIYILSRYKAAKAILDGGKQGGERGNIGFWQTAITPLNTNRRHCTAPCPTIPHLLFNITEGNIRMFYF